MYWIRIAILAISLFLLVSCSVNRGKVNITRLQQDLSADLYIDGELQKNNLSKYGEMTFSAKTGQHHIEVVQWGVTILDTTVLVDGGAEIVGLAASGMASATLMMIGAGPILEIIVFAAGFPVAKLVAPVGEYRANTDKLAQRQGAGPNWLWLKVPEGPITKYLDRNHMLPAESFCYDSRKDRVWATKAGNHKLPSISREMVSVCEVNGNSFNCKPSFKEVWENYPCVGAAN